MLGRKPNRVFSPAQPRTQPPARPPPPLVVRQRLPATLCAARYPKVHPSSTDQELLLLSSSALSCVLPAALDFDDSQGLVPRRRLEAPPHPLTTHPPPPLSCLALPCLPCASPKSLFCAACFLSSRLLHLPPPPPPPPSLTLGPARHREAFLFFSTRRPLLPSSLFPLHRRLALPPLERGAWKVQERQFSFLSPLSSDLIFPDFLFCSSHDIVCDTPLP